MAEVLILDDDQQFCRMLAEHVQRAGHGVSVAHTLEEGTARLRSIPYDVLFLDVQLPDGSGLSILPEIRAGVFPPEVIIVTGYGDDKGAELAIEHGAWDYIRKESSIQALSLSLSRALQYRESRKGASQRALFHAPRMVGSSATFRSALAVAAQAAGSDVNCLVTGETGTGKELCAYAIHENSGRAAGSFVTVDCASLPPSLVGSILFGHERGAFSGADRAHRGLIEQADGGTLFLDEVGDMPMDIQRAFLRVLQDGNFRPVGSEKTRVSDFRVVAATNRNLNDMATRGIFREDLLFRLRSLNVVLPPMRERMDDLQLLTTHFVTEQCQTLGCDMMGFNEGFFQTLAAYEWPGNVRELFQAVAGAVAAATAGTDTVLFDNHLPPHVRSSVIQANMKRAASSASVQLSPEEPASNIEFSHPLLPLRDMRGHFEKAYLEEMVRHAAHDIEKACQVSGLSRPHVYALLKKHGLRL
jgi:two-component system, NtrC family, response regulator